MPDFTKAFVKKLQLLSQCLFVAMKLQKTVKVAKKVSIFLYSSLKIKRKLVLGRIVIILLLMNYSGLSCPRNLTKKVQDADKC